ncbi:MAG: fibronectin type III domain-containing protein, partial [Deltaproteobacteria bacterium]|nr:fibronectin type III domain-containing protein [Deltaproteobacteria bacterium]
DALVPGVYEVSARRDSYSRQAVDGVHVVADAATQVSLITLTRQGGALTIREAPYTQSRTIHLALSASNAIGYRASEDQTFSDPALGDVTTSTPHAFTSGSDVTFTLTDTDDAHDVYVVFVDAQANVSDPAVGSVTLDRKPPEAPQFVINTGGAYTNASGGIVTLSVTSAQDLPVAAGESVSGIGQMQISNFSDFSAPQTLPFNLVQTWTLDAPATDGLKTVYMRLVDRANNLGAITPVQIALDTKAPQNASILLTGSGSGSGLSTSPVVTATLSATDANAGTSSQNLLVRLANDSGFVGAQYQPFTSTVTWFLLPGDGAKTVYAQFADPAGNESLVVSGNITLDSTPPSAPTIAITEQDSRPTNGYTNNRDVLLTLGSSGSPAAVTAKVSENPSLSSATTYDLTHGTSGLVFTLANTQGLHTLWGRFYDSAGNASDLASASVTLDTVAPLAQAVTLTPSNGFTNSTSIAITPPSAGQDELSVATGGTTGVTAPSGFVSAPAGTPIAVTLTSAQAVKTLTVTYRDLADNTTTLAATTTTLDTAAPAAVNFLVKGALGDGTASTSVSVTPVVTLDFSSQSDALSGLAQMAIANDGATFVFQTFSGSAAVPWTLTAGDGAKTVSAKFMDKAGNVSGIVTGTITVDTQAPTSPTLTILEGDGNENGYTKSRTVSLGLSAGGAPTRAVVSEDPTFPAGSSTTYTLPGTPPFSFILGSADGVHTLYARYFDAAGNGSSTATASVTLDRTAPLATAPTLGNVVAVGSTNFAGTAAITIAAPPGVGQDTVTVSGSGLAPSTPQTFPAATGVALPLTLASGNGPKSFTVTWNDLAGNSCAPIAVSVTLDGAKPSTIAYKIAGRLADNSVSNSLTIDPAVVLDFSGVFDDFSAGTSSASGISSVKLSNDPTLTGAIYQAFSAAMPWTLVGAQGAQTVYAQFKDAVGNESVVSSASITLDSKGPGSPSMTFNETGDTRQHNGVTKSPALQVVLSANGAPRKVLWGLDSTFTVFSEDDTLTGSAPSVTEALTLPNTDGSYIVYAKFLDAAGNESDVVANTIILDTVAPTSVTAALSPSGQTASPTVYFIPPVSVGDIDTVRFVTTAGKAGLSAPTTFQTVTPGLGIALTLDTSGANSGDGLRSFDVTWRDAADNTVSGGTYTINLDRTAPAGGALTITGKLADGSTTTTVTSTTAVSLSFGTITDLTGVASVELSNDDNSFATASFQAFTDPLAWTLATGDGTHTVYAKLKDNAGNITSSFISKSIDLRTTPPSGGSLVIESGALATSKVTPQTISLAIDAQGATEMAIFVNSVGVTTGNAGFIPFANAASIALPAGDGNKNVLVRFRNQARVEGGSVSGNIVLDTSAPQAASISLAGTLGDGSASNTSSTSSPASTSTPGVFTTNPAVVVTVIPPANDDVTQMAFATTTPGTSCSATTGSPFTGSPTFVTFSAGSTQILPGGDGGKRVCVLLKDRAGNYSLAKAIGVDIALDQNPPSNPSFVDIESGVTNNLTLPPTGTATVTPVTDSLGGPVTYQCLGGNPGQTGWYTCTVNASTNQLASPFTLTSNSVNTIGIRALDQARNPSAGSFISVRHDSIPPNVPVLTKVTGDHQAITLDWDPPDPTGFIGDAVVGYKVNYGFSPGDTHGTGAAQGSSPVIVGNLTSMRLTALSAQVPYYVSVEALDAAGNSSGPTGEVVATANALSPRVLSTIGGDLRQISPVLPQYTGTSTTPLSDTSNYFIANTQGLVKFSISTNDATSPLVLGRVYVPDILPDDASHLATIACTNGSTPGYCSIPTGTTGQGAYQADSANQRASAPIVFFPHTATSTTFSSGVVLAALPTRPLRATVAAFGTTSTPVVFTAGADGVRAYDLTKPRQPALLAVQSVAFQSINDMAVLNGTTLLIYGRRPSDNFNRLFQLSVTNVQTTHTIGNATSLLLNDKSGNQLPGGGTNAAALSATGIYVFHADATTSTKCDLSAFTLGVQNAASTVTLDDFANYSGTGSTCNFISATAANGRVYGFVQESTTNNSSAPYVFGVKVAGTTIDSTILKLAYPSPFDGFALSAAAGHIGTTSTNEDALISTSASRTLVQRWSVTNPSSGAGALTSSAGRFQEVVPNTYAEHDSTLFVPSASTDSIIIIDIANPFAPLVVGSGSSGAGRTAGYYTKLVVHGQYLVALVSSTAVPATSKGFDLYRIATTPGAPSSLLYLGTTSNASLSSLTMNDLAVAGKWAIASVNPSGDLVAIDVSSKGVPGTFTAVGLTNTGEGIMNLAARTGTELVSGVDTTFPAIVYGATSPTSTTAAATFKTYRFNGASFLASGSSTLPLNLTTSVRVSADTVLIGGRDGGNQVTISLSSAPQLTAGISPVAGPLFDQGGYLTGLGPFNEPNGPNFTTIGNGFIGGYLLYSGCVAAGTGAGTMTHRNGVYTASCGPSGIAVLTAVDPGGGVLLKRNDLSASAPTSTQAGAPFFTDGHLSALGGANAFSPTTIYGSSETSNISSTPSVPVSRLDLPDPGVAARWMNFADGVLFVTGNNFSNTINKLYAYEWLNFNNAGSQARGTFSFGTSAPFAINAPPVNDDDFLYAAQPNSTSSTILDTVQVIDLRDPSNLTQPTTPSRAIITPGAHVLSMALSRQRLFLGLNTNAIDVMDVSTVNVAAGLVQKTSIALPSTVKQVTGIAAAGNVLFFTYSTKAAQPTPAGWGAVQLGSANRDGSGANVVLSADSFSQPPREPVIAGDTLYMMQNLGLATWDLTPLWNSQNQTLTQADLPIFLGGSINQDANRSDPVRFMIDGVFGYMVGGTYRVFDLR